MKRRFLLQAILIAPAMRLVPVELSLLAPMEALWPRVVAWRSDGRGNFTCAPGSIRVRHENGEERWV